MVARVEVLEGAGGWRREAGGGGGVVIDSDKTRYFEVAGGYRPNKFLRKVL